MLRIAETGMSPRLLSDRWQPTLLGSTTCMETSGNGCRIVIRTPTSPRRRTGLPLHSQAAETGWCVVGPGLAIRPGPAPPAVTQYPQVGATMPSGFAWPEPSTDLCNNGFLRDRCPAAPRNKAESRVPDRGGLIRQWPGWRATACLMTACRNSADSWLVHILLRSSGLARDP
jgi:hypothetical protein